MVPLGFGVMRVLGDGWRGVVTMGDESMIFELISFWFRKTASLDNFNEM